MAEPSAATQSPSISSSSSGAELSAPGGGGSPGACPALGTKSCSSSCAVHDLIFWRDVKKTGFVFGTTLIMLLSLAAFSVISVVSYLILALLSVTISFRIYKSVIQAVQKSEEGHPFKPRLITMLASPEIRPSQLLKRSKQNSPESPKKRQNNYMETRNATVTKTPFNSYNVVTCTMKEHTQCQLEPAFQAFFLIWCFLPSFPFNPQYQAQKLMD
uniref:Reticulon n=1 Tax=Piliocolobus tephrosceles TaxID=591936 RepID=A0A8C9H5W9_9PRIM